MPSVALIRAVMPPTLSTIGRALSGVAINSAVDMASAIAALSEITETEIL